MAALLGGVIPIAGTPDTAPKTHVVHLINGPIHYDFLLPLTPETREVFVALSAHHPQLEMPDATWLLLGWGARDFYTTVGNYSDLSARAIWRGVTGDAAVMRVDVVGVLPAGLPTRELALSDQQYATLLNEIAGSFDSWTPLPQGGFGSADRFYPAQGRFHIGRTCNVWIGRMLRASGLKFGVWTPLPASVSLSHYLYGGR